MKFIFNSCLASLLALGLISCGSGSSEVAGIDGSGAPAKIDTEGTVDGFGSIIVNGVKYETSKADVIINGQSVMEDNLRAGYRVRIIGSIDNQTKVATADKIEFVPDLVGSISAIDLSSQQLTLLKRCRLPIAVYFLPQFHLMICAAFLLAIVCKLAVCLRKINGLLCALICPQVLIKLPE